MLPTLPLEKTAGQTAIASCISSPFTLLLEVVFLLAISLHKIEESMPLDTKWHSSQAFCSVAPTSYRDSHIGANPRLTIQRLMPDDPKLPSPSDAN